MVRIARIAAVGEDDVVIVSAQPAPTFTPHRTGRYFVRMLAPRDVYDLIEERSLGEYRLVSLKTECACPEWWFPRKTAKAPQQHHHSTCPKHRKSAPRIDAPSRAPTTTHE